MTQQVIPHRIRRDPGEIARILQEIPTHGYLALAYTSGSTVQLCRTEAGDFATLGSYWSGVPPFALAELAQVVTTWATRFVVAETADASTSTWAHLYTVDPA